ncbi:hypothetical protein M8998_14930 [Sphingobacterium sp. lm-10]|uniref:hypothetical protein n=1 Tax=Sphingobacterium sp. lm-10 TaxID=2944904 RepID=UPI00201FE8B0|nr:hypothetical protein [Sphingobacterium sp. lm-10]MCL7989242.1 hypothetical protein [Sphingobacterium sp. lm-10]
MKKVGFSIAILMTALSVLPVFAQKKLAVLDFSDDLCIYKGYYDANKYTETVLKDTYFLSRAALYFDGDNLEELKSSYDTLKNQFSSLKIVQTPDFIMARDSMLRYLEESYDIQQIRVGAADDPKCLKGKFENNKQVQQYVTALVDGGDVLLKEYGQLVKEQMERNAYPEALWKKYEANMKLDHRQEIAFDYVLTYGWWNQVNDLIYHYDNDGTLTEKFYELFERVVTVDCDEV